MLDWLFMSKKDKNLTAELLICKNELNYWKEEAKKYKEKYQYCEIKKGELELDTGTIAHYKQQIEKVKDKIAELNNEINALKNTAQWWKDEADYLTQQTNVTKDFYAKESRFMSYDVKLVDHTTHKVLEADSPHFMQGGTFCPRGTKELWLNITYNYAAVLCKVLQREIIDQETGKRITLVGLDAIKGLYAAETISMLRKAINSLSDEGANENYWHPTEGNVKKALIQLKALADMRPDGVWEVA